MNKSTGKKSYQVKNEKLLNFKRKSELILLEKNGVLLAMI